MIQVLKSCSMTKPNKAWEKCNWYTKYANNMRGYHLTWVESKFNPDSLAEGEEIKVDGVCFYFGSRRFGDT